MIRFSEDVDISIIFANMIVNDDITFKNNQANRGGAIYIQTNAHISGTGKLTLEKNSATYGGAIFNNDTLTFDDSFNLEILDNHASENGGGLYINDTFQLNTNFKLYNNSADNYGGGIFANVAMNLHSVDMRNNSAYQGGAFYLKSNVTFSNTGSNFDKNEASNLGGIAYNSGGSLSFPSSPVMTDNKGGASYNTYTSCIIGGVTKVNCLCLTSTPYFYDKACHKCPQSTSYYYNSKCNKCPQNTPYYYSNKCNQCPQSTIYYYNGKCNQCPQSTPYYYSSKCNKCPSGQQYISGKCQVPCISNASWDGTQCVCNVGYYYNYGFGAYFGFSNSSCRNGIGNKQCVYMGGTSYSITKIKRYTGWCNPNDAEKGHCPSSRYVTYYRIVGRNSTCR